MNSSRGRFPQDLLIILLQPLLCIPIILLSGAMLPLMGAIRHPSSAGWLMAFEIATTTALIGTLLLFLAKLPQYRSRIFWRIGSRDLPPQHQRLYRLAFLLLIPSLLTLAALVPLASRIH